MKNSAQWLRYFRKNQLEQRIDWTVPASVTPEELQPILAPLRAWQLGETSDGENLRTACRNYARRYNDPVSLEVIEYFIAEEQKHGENLGKWLDRIEQPRLKKNPGDSMFRFVRHLFQSMEIWTMTVITVECIAQQFYSSLRNATQCPLLRQICTDILIDEAPHIRFQLERLQHIYRHKNMLTRLITGPAYRLFFFATSSIAWINYRSLFKAGGLNFQKYRYIMQHKYRKTIARIGAEQLHPSPAPDPVYYRHKQTLPEALFNAFTGLKEFFTRQRNARIQAVAAALVLITGIGLQITLWEWLAVVGCCGMVIGTEIINTALETLCNQVQPGYHPAIRQVKDLAAAAVLFVSLISAIIGSLIFLPRLLQW